MVISAPSPLRGPPVSWSAYSGKGGTCRLDQLHKNELSTELSPKITDHPISDSSPSCSDEPHPDGSSYEPEPPNTRPLSGLSSESSRPTYVSIVESPFGPLALTVNDPSSYSPHFPVFADDAGEQDVQVLLEHGLEMLDTIQVRSIDSW